jgi:hypothetical protein
MPNRLHNTSIQIYSARNKKSQPTRAQNLKELAMVHQTVLGLEDVSDNLDTLSTKKKIQATSFKSRISLRRKLPEA